MATVAEPPSDERYDSAVVHLRATRKVLPYLDPPSARASQPDSALGDWFVNRFVRDRQPLLILVSSASLLPIFEPARKVRSLPDRLPSIVRRRLTELGIDDALIADELDAMDEIVIAPTNDRSVVGSMNEFVFSSRHYAPPDSGWNREALSALEGWLQRMPCRVTCPQSETVFPADLARELLSRRVN